MTQLLKSQAPKWITETGRTAMFRVFQLRLTLRDLQMARMKDAIVHRTARTTFTLCEY